MSSNSWRAPAIPLRRGPLSFTAAPMRFEGSPVRALYPTEREPLGLFGDAAEDQAFRAIEGQDPPMLTRNPYRRAWNSLAGDAFPPGTTVEVQIGDSLDIAQTQTVRVGLLWDGQALAGPAPSVGVPSTTLFQVEEQKGNRLEVWISDDGWFTEDKPVKVRVIPPERVAAREAELAADEKARDDAGTGLGEGLKDISGAVKWGAAALIVVGVVAGGIYATRVVGL